MTHVLCLSSLFTVAERTHVELQAFLQINKFKERKKRTFPLLNNSYSYLARKLGVTHVDLMICPVPAENVNYNPANWNKQYISLILDCYLWSWIINRSKCLTSFQVYMFPLFKVWQVLLPVGVVVVQCSWLETLDWSNLCICCWTRYVPSIAPNLTLFVPNAHMWYIGFGGQV